MNQVTKRNSNPNKPFEAGHSHGTFVQNHYAGEKGTHWDKTNKENYHFTRMLMLSLFVLFHCIPCSASPARGFCTTWMTNCKEYITLCSLKIKIFCLPGDKAPLVPPLYVPHEDQVQSWLLYFDGQYAPIKKQSQTKQFSLGYIQ